MVSWGTENLEIIPPDRVRSFESLSCRWVGVKGVITPFLERLPTTCWGWVENQPQDVGKCVAAAKLVTERAF